MWRYNDMQWMTHGKFKNWGGEFISKMVSPMVVLVSFIMGGCEHGVDNEEYMSPTVGFFIFRNIVEKRVIAKMPR